MLNFYPTPLFQTWVKNVYSMWLTGVKTRGYLSPASRKKATIPVKHSAQISFSTHTMNTFPPALYTAIFAQITDVISYLSPLSTAPIIKTKEIN